MKLPVTTDPLTVGDKVSVHVGKVVHGGHCIAHHEGKTIFVRGAIDGEYVQVRITSRRKRVYFAETISVYEPSVHRVSAPCQSSPECGGCDFQFVDMTYQRLLKGRILQESLLKFSGLDPTVIERVVESSVRELHSGDGAGSHWRHRSRFVWRDGWHMRRHSSHELVPTPACTIITHEMQQALDRVVNLPEDEYVVAEGLNGVSLASEVKHESGPAYLEYAAFGIRWRVPPRAFWQADPRIINAIAEFVDEFVPVSPGEKWWDLYGGAGVFAAYLAGRVGDSGLVTTVDLDVMSHEAALKTLGKLRNMKIVRSDVEGFLRATQGIATRGIDGVLLDPPRAGAGESVSRMIMDLAPRQLVYIACDPVALSRDIKFLSEKYSLIAVRAWDAFPMSHHFETVAVMTLNVS